MVKFIPGNATVIAESVSTSMSDKSDKAKKAKKAINPVDQVLTFARRKFEAVLRGTRREVRLPFHKTV